MICGVSVCACAGWKSQGAYPLIMMHVCRRAFLECAVDLACACTLAHQHLLVDAIMFRAGDGVVAGSSPHIVKALQMCPFSAEM